MTSMEVQLHALREARLERDRMVKLLGAVPSPPEGTRPARIVVVETAGPFQTALLDRGRADGIVPGANEAMAEAQYVEIVNSYDKYSKTPATKQRFLALHTEIQGWMA